MRIIPALALLAALAATTGFADEAKKPECAKVEVMAKRLIAERNLAYLSDAIDSSHAVHMWFVNGKTGHWVQIKVDHDLMACVEMEGYDWHYAAGG